jgi:hypothetical protein
MIHQVFPPYGTLCTPLASISVSARSSKFLRYLDVSFGEAIMKAIKHFATAVSYTISQLGLVSQYLAPVDTGCLLELDFPLWVSVHPAVSRREVISIVADAASFSRFRMLSRRNLTLD